MDTKPELDMPYHPQALLPDEPPVTIAQNYADFLQKFCFFDPNSPTNTNPSSMLSSPSGLPTLLHSTVSQDAVSKAAAALELNFDWSQPPFVVKHKDVYASDSSLSDSGITTCRESSSTTPVLGSYVDAV